MKYRDYLKRLKPILDKRDEYMFFSINKVLQTSINRSVLKDRAIIYKDNSEVWEAKFNNYCDRDIASMFKFTFVRNPWDKTVSFFFYYKRIGDSIVQGFGSFDEFVCKLLKKGGVNLDAHLEMQYPKVYFQDKKFLDYIGRFENASEDWVVVAKTINAPESLPHDNKTRHKHYSDYYSPQSVKVIADIYKKDINAFGYSFVTKKTKFLDLPFIELILRK